MPEKKKIPEWVTITLLFAFVILVCVTDYLTSNEKDKCEIARKDYSTLSIQSISADNKATVLTVMDSIVKCNCKGK